MTKQEKIQEDWAKMVGYEKWNVLKEWIDKDGYGIYPNVQGHDVKYTKELWDSVDGLKIRPISLRGIENNNGWVSLNTVDDFPKEHGLYWFLCEGEILASSIGELTSVHKYYKEATHYQPIVKPEPPLF